MDESRNLFIFSRKKGNPQGSPVSLETESHSYHYTIQELSQKRNQDKPVIYQLETKERPEGSLTIQATNQRLCN
jgi:hypothetical protein